MTYQPRLRFEQRTPTGCVLYDDADPIAEIRDLRLCNVDLSPAFFSSRHPDTQSPLSPSPRRSPGSRFERRRTIGQHVPLPLYWQQYANHQDPERNAGSHGRLECSHNSSSKLSLVIESVSHSREVTSHYELDVTYSEKHASYQYEVRCRLDVAEGKTWRVTHNPHHGELEFCSLWPEGTFVLAKRNLSPPRSSPQRRGSSPATKRYNACYVQRAARVEGIPHHHLESSDKHNIPMGQGDRFLWLLEYENPVVEIVSSQPVTAGLCAYMWDAHFAYRVCEDGQDVDLPPGSSFEAHYRLYAIGREEGEEIVAVATPREAPEIETIPLYVDGVNTFSDVFSNQRLDPHLRGDEEKNEDERWGDIWPWDHAPDIPNVLEHTLDRTEGHSDDASVRIDAHKPRTGRWLATTLGPAFGSPSFEPTKRYRLTAYVKTRQLDGEARIGLRLHRSGKGDVFDLDDYETYYSDDAAAGTTKWEAIEVTTPVIDPPPDRIHLLLEMKGTGTAWFDDVLFERNV